MSVMSERVQEDVILDGWFETSRMRVRNLSLTLSTFAHV